MKLENPFLRLAVLVAVFSLLGCAGNPALKESRLLLEQGRLDDSVLRLEKGMRDYPDDRELRAQYFRQRDSAVSQLLKDAETELLSHNTDAAQAIYLRAQKLDNYSPSVRDGLAAIATKQRHEAMIRDAQALSAKGDLVAAMHQLRTVLAENSAQNDARRLLQSLRDKDARVEPSAQALATSFNKPITLEFRDTPLKTVFEVIARSSGLNFVFDKDVRTDTKVTIFVRNTGMEDIMKLILTTNQLQWKLLNENSVLVYPNTPAKAKDYLELVTRSFYLANAEVKQAQALVRSLVKTKDIFIDEKLNLLVIKDTPAAVKLAEQLLESLDIAEPEVMLDVEVLEMTRSKLQELGLRFPDQIGYGLLQPNTSSTIVNSGVTQTTTNLGGALAAGNVDLRNTSGLTTYVSNPALTLNLKNQTGDGNILANPRIRVKNREKAKIHIGDKLPVFTTTSTANVGVASSVSYLDVGLKLDVEPNVYLDDEVSIKVGLEVSSLVKEVTGPADSLAYQIGTRSASTVLRLKNGETQVLAGLISDEERSSANRLPGLGELPVLGRLFSSQRDNSSKTEIVLLITPRIVRNLNRPVGVSVNLPAGSESAVGAPALQLNKSAPRGLSLSSKPAGSAPATPEPNLPEPTAISAEPIEMSTNPAPAAAMSPPDGPVPVKPEGTLP
ncbi:secretin N-terminal domain-containing protein [Rhodoferax sp. U11-2br]|uniref:secretin N-terminal domain-containing protein n=1 Tax=Rhodoferax sp. U11-2br TaxID=2838878 RepID=UPI001BE92ECB|nr:secretin N-terminal domain-containing protein [Rhodoferax sp. U11-2br]MBT3067990.1 general secretion pathway protein GspD [Rhodoferax sp. U11-2br]